MLKQPMTTKSELKINQEAANAIFQEAFSDLSTFKTKVSKAIDEYKWSSWYLYPSRLAEYKNGGEKHERITDVESLEAIVKTSASTKKLAHELIKYIDDDNNFFFAWFSPLRSYVRAAVAEFKQNHKLRAIDKRLQIFSVNEENHSTLNTHLAQAQEPEELEDDSSSASHEESFESERVIFREQQAALKKTQAELQAKILDLEAKLAAKPPQSAQPAQPQQRSPVKQPVTKNVQSLPKRALPAFSPAKPHENPAAALMTPVSTQQINPELAQVKQQLASTESTLRSLKEQLASAETTKLELQKELGITSAQKLKDQEELQRLSKELAQAQENLASTKNLQQQLQEKSTQLLKTTEKMQAISDELSLAKEKLASTENMQERLQEKSAQLLHLTEELRSARDERTLVKAVVASPDSNHQRLEEQLALANASIRDLQQDLQKSSAQILADQTKMQAISEELAQAQSKLAASHEDQETLVENFASATQQNFEIHQQLQEKSAELLQNTEDMQRIKGEFEQTKKNLASAEALQRELQEQLAQTQNKSEELQTAKDELEQTKMQLASAETLQRQTQEKLVQVPNQSEELLSAKDQLEQTKKQLAITELSLKELTNKNSELLSENDQKEQTINAQSYIITSLRDVIDKLTARLTSFQALADKTIDTLSNMFIKATLYFRNAVVDNDKSASTISSAVTSVANKFKSIGRKPKKVLDRSSDTQTHSDAPTLAGIPSKTESLGRSKSKKIGAALTEAKPQAPALPARKGDSSNKKSGTNNSKKTEALSAEEQPKQPDLSGSTGNSDELVGRDLRESARNQRNGTEARGEVYNLNFSHIDPESGKPIDDLANQYFAEQGQLIIATKEATHVSKLSSQAIVYDETNIQRLEQMERALAEEKVKTAKLAAAEQRLTQMQQLEQTLLEEKSRNVMRLQAAEQRLTQMQQLQQALAEEKSRNLIRLEAAEQRLDQIAASEQATTKETTIIPASTAANDNNQSESVVGDATVVADGVVGGVAVGGVGADQHLLLAENAALKIQVEELTKRLQQDSSSPATEDTSAAFAPPPPPPPAPAPATVAPINIRGQKSQSNNSAGFFNQAATSAAAESTAAKSTQPITTEPTLTPSQELAGKLNSEGKFVFRNKVDIAALKKKQADLAQEQPTNFLAAALAKKFGNSRKPTFHEQKDDAEVVKETPEADVTQQDADEDKDAAVAPSEWGK